MIEDDTVRLQNPFTMLDYILLIGAIVVISITILSLDLSFTTTATNAVNNTLPPFPQEIMP